MRTYGGVGDPNVEFVPVSGDRAAVGYVGCEGRVEFGERWGGIGVQLPGSDQCPKCATGRAGSTLATKEERVRNTLFFCRMRPRGCSPSVCRRRRIRSSCEEPV